MFESEMLLFIELPIRRKAQWDGRSDYLKYFDLILLKLFLAVAMFESEMLLLYRAPDQEEGSMGWKI